MLAASSSAAVQIESNDTMYGIDRSPKAVASASTAAVAPPKVQIDERVFGGRWRRIEVEQEVDQLVGQAGRVAALPVAAVLPERDDRVERLLHLAVGHLAGEVGHQLAQFAERLQQRLALVRVAGEQGRDRIDPAAPRRLRDSPDPRGSSRTR